MSDLRDVIRDFVRETKTQGNVMWCDDCRINKQ